MSNDLPGEVYPQNYKKALNLSMPKAELFVKIR